MAARRQIARGYSGKGTIIASLIRANDDPCSVNVLCLIGTFIITASTTASLESEESSKENNESEMFNFYLCIFGAAKLGIIRLIQAGKLLASALFVAGSKAPSSVTNSP